ncbi:MAG: hypothetical protein ACTSQI_18975 [Candidatus Helarchaeota archaeon]
MALGSILEIIWEEFYLSFYQDIGEAFVYFLGFIGLIFLTYAFEKIAKLRVKGFFTLVPFTFAIMTLIIGVRIIEFPYLFIALIIAFIPFLFFYIAYSFTGEVRKRSILTGLGFFLIFAGEAVNYHVILRSFPFLIDIFGPTSTILPPLIILTGLLTLTQIKDVYVILSIIPDMNVIPRSLLVMAPDGRCMYSYKFEKKNATDENLITSFISGISSVIQEITKSSTYVDLISQKDIFIRV